VNFINTGDPVEVPELSSKISGSPPNAFIEVNYHQRIDKDLPALQYMWATSDDLSFGSWKGAIADETNSVWLNPDYEEVTHRFGANTDASQFYQLKPMAWAISSWLFPARFIR
jgi:hypothetical protein